MDLFMLISVHVPKTGGKAFRNWLRSAYGTDHVMVDYTDRPTDPTAPMNADRFAWLEQARRFSPRPTIEVIHGHFWPRKYEHLKGDRITFLRDPVDRTISHFFYWKCLPYQGNRLHRVFLDSDMSIVEFAALPQFARFYSGLFFEQTDMRTFDFVGDWSHRDAEFKRLGALLGRVIECAFDNENPYPNYEAAKQEFLSDRKVTAYLRDLVSDDLRFYEAYAGR